MDLMQKKVLLVLNKIDIERLAYEPGGPDILLNDEVLTIDYNTEESYPLLDNLRSRNLLNKGAILIQSPYDPNSYAAADIAIQDFAHEKHFVFTYFCSLLGAKEVQTEQLDIETEEASTSASVEGKLLKAKPNVKIDKNSYEQLTKRLSVHDKYNGGDPDLTAAEKLLREKRLLGDSNMMSLLNIRRSSNKIISRIVNLSLTDESQTNLRIAASMKIPVFLSINASHQKAIKKRIEYNLRLKVAF